MKLLKRLVVVATIIGGVCGGICKASPVSPVPKVENLVPGVFSAPVPVSEGPIKPRCLFLNGTTLYCGGDNAIWIYDVSDPLKPRKIGIAKGVGAPRQLVEQDGYIYVSTRETGLWIVDARNKTKPKVLTRFDTIELATAIDVAGPVLFVGQRQNGVEFIDVSNPAKPAHIRIHKTNESQSCVYRDGILYSGDWGAGEITAIDAHDMETVKTLSLSPLKGHGDGVAVLGNRLYASTGHHYHDATKSKEENFGNGHGLEIFDITDPAKPKFISRCQFPRFYVLGGDWWTPRPSADGKTVFAADTHNGLFAVDCTDERNPRIIARLTYPGQMIGDRPSEIVNYVAVGDGAVYVAVDQVGLVVLPSSRAKPVTRVRQVPPKNPGFRIPYPTPSKSRFSAWMPSARAQVRGAAPYGRYLYVASASAGLDVLAEDGRGGVLSARHIPVAFCGDVKVRDGLLYSAEGLDGLAVYSLEDPLAPREIARCRDFGVRVNCAIWVWKPQGRWIVVSNRENGYIFLDAQDPQNMKSKLRSGGCPGWDRYVADDTVGGFLAQSTANTGFKWIDLRGETPLETRFGRPHVGGLNDGCCVFKNGKILRMMNGRFVQLDPAQPLPADGSIWTGPIASDAPAKMSPTGQPAWDGRDRLVLTRRISRQISLIDVKDPAAPRFLWNEEVPGQPDTAVFWKNRIVVPCGYQGLLIEN